VDGEIAGDPEGPPKPFRFNSTTIDWLADRQSISSITVRHCPFSKTLTKALQFPPGTWMRRGTGCRQPSQPSRLRRGSVAKRCASGPSFSAGLIGRPVA
jgi:hypothetical protein